jgi:hypothetical protein
VPEHYIPLDTFIETARETEAIIAALNERRFGGAVSYRVVVVPPREGTFLAYLGVTVATIGGAAWVFLQSEPGDAFLRELTGHNFKELMGIAGRKVRERILNKPPVARPTEVASESNALDVAVPGPTAEERLATSIIVVETTRTFLMTDADKLHRSGLNPETFQEGFEARNRFYRACAEESKIRALGFDHTNEFPIKRKDFARLQVPIEAYGDVAVAETTTVDTTTLTVSSPNWDRGDRKRHWRGREPNGGLRYFQVADEGFWALASNDRLNLRGRDVMKVQWAYDQSGKQRRNFRVLKVLEYNGEVLAERLDENALNAILGPHSGEIGDHQDLFGSRGS